MVDNYCSEMTLVNGCNFGPQNAHAIIKHVYILLHNYSISKAFNLAPHLFLHGLLFAWQDHSHQARSVSLLFEPGPLQKLTVCDMTQPLPECLHRGEHYKRI